MPRITSYPTITPTSSDLVLLSDVSGANNPTKTATVGSITGVISDVTAPTTTTSTGVTGQIAVDGKYLYLCYDTDNWRRVLIDGSW